MDHIVFRGRKCLKRGRNDRIMTKTSGKRKNRSLAPAAHLDRRHATATLASPQNMGQLRNFNGATYIHVALSGAASVGLGVFVSVDRGSVINSKLRRDAVFSPNQDVSTKQHDHSTSREEPTATRATSRPREHGSP